MFLRHSHNGADRSFETSPGFFISPVYIDQVPQIMSRKLARNEVESKIAQCDLTWISTHTPKTLSSADALSKKDKSRSP